MGYERPLPLETRARCGGAGWAIPFVFAVFAAAGLAFVSQLSGSEASGNNSFRSDARHGKREVQQDGNSDRIVNNYNK